MRVDLYFKSLKLGTLSYKNNEYIYNSDIKGEKEAKEYYILDALYELWDSKDVKSTKLFDIFSEIINNISVRKDILAKMGYNKDDDHFTMLCKYGTLLQIDHGFWINTRV